MSLTLAKPDGKKRKRRRDRERQQVRSDLRKQVLSTDGRCMNPECPGIKKTGPAPFGLPYLHTAHIGGRGRGAGDDPSECICLCWWCHRLVDGQHHKLWRELTPDERMIKILDFHQDTVHYRIRGWAAAHEQLKRKRAA